MFQMWMRTAYAKCYLDHLLPDLLSECFLPDYSTISVGYRCSVSISLAVPINRLIFALSKPGMKIALIIIIPILIGSVSAGFYLINRKEERTEDSWPHVGIHCQGRPNSLPIPARDCTPSMASCCQHKNDRDVKPVLNTDFNSVGSASLTSRTCYVVYAGATCKLEMYFQQPPAFPIHCKLGDYNNTTTANGTGLTTLSKPMVSKQSDIFLGGDNAEFFFPFNPAPFHPAMERDSLEMRESNFSMEHNIFKGFLATVTTYHNNTEQPSLPVKPVLPSIDFLMSSNKIKCRTDVKQQEKSSNRRMKRHKQGQSAHLWEFVRDLLLNPMENHEIVRWEDRREGIFRVIKSNAFAQLWGNEKNNKGMNYEKLSRALRHYYKTGILERVDGRLTYKFGEKAYGWKETRYL
ncbi:uncharacterized protein [Heterodontus francisci]|uniref:uncharacterized protein n=1 Tax=Heterodontus francisci TaxID=7792 RepID=UPI00355B3A83